MRARVTIAGQSASLCSMARLYAFALGLALACTASPSVAGEVRGLYEAQVPVPSKRAADREAALGVALRQVVTKVSGRREAGSNPIVAQALRAPGRFLQQYEYRAAASDEAAAPGLRLWTRFDADVVEGLVRDAGLPVWGRTRPAVLVWAAVERDGERQLLGSEDWTGMLGSLRQSAGQRGIPLLIPLLDLEDRAALGIADLWAGFTDDVRAASARYETEAILVVRAEQVLSTLWEARWSLLLPDAEQHWNTQSDVAELLLEDGMHIAADVLASRYANLADLGATGRVALVVTAIRTVEDYARALAYLGSLDEVEGVEVVQVDPGQIRFDVDVRGGRAAIRQIIALGTTFAAEGYAGPEGALQMRLLP